SVGGPCDRRGVLSRVGSPTGEPALLVVRLGRGGPGRCGRPGPAMTRPHPAMTRRWSLAVPPFRDAGGRDRGDGTARPRLHGGARCRDASAIAGLGGGGAVRRGGVVRG